ncbi:MAG TPA: PQQ-dependent dehydrogenase, methanol/ethanol family [Bryobacteraceae bacterium]|nr:PQQ-dependent dehydrogenase, methanol/ethanol family [Bryobacteraceae bacterium]
MPNLHFSNATWRAAMLAAMLAVCTRAQPRATPSITYRDLLDGLKNPSRWLTYSGDYTGRQHSPLTQLTPLNVKGLAPQWTFQTDMPVAGRGFETHSLLLDGVLYVTGINDHAWALDAYTGRPIWHYRRELPPKLTYCCGPVNRGFGILGDRLFKVTLDAHLIALDRRTGAVMFDVPMADYRQGYAATLAPLVVKDKVIVGVAGGEFPTRCFLDAYDATTGERVWRFYTVPAPGEPGSESWPSQDVMTRGGGSIWVTGSYDPELNLIYYGTGNPNPDFYGDDRKGDNLYTDTLLAVDADTGKLKWHYQFTPHDTHDWDSTQVPVLADVTLGGQRRKVVMLANRNGFLYSLDRATGKLLLAKPFSKAATVWAKEIGADGRPVVINESGTADACLGDQRGSTNFMPPSYDPALNLFFVNTRETCAVYVPIKPAPGSIKPGERLMGGALQRYGDPYGAIRALDASTGERKWEFRYTTYSMAGVLSTASGLVFTGDSEGNFIALDSKTGKSLWHYQMGGPIWGAAPTTYMLGGRQWVLAPSGTTLVAFALPGAAQ